MTLKVRNVPGKRWWDGWIALASIAVISLVAIRLWATDWTADLYLLNYVTFFAAVVGLALGVSRFSAIISALFSSAYGLFIISWLFGTTIQSDISWRDRLLTILWGRLSFAVNQFLAGKTVMDPIFFLALMAVLFWVLGSFSAFILIRRGNVWPILIPLGIGLLVISHYDPSVVRNTRFLISFLFLSLLLVGRMTYLRYRENWEREGIQTTTITQSDFSKTLLIVTAALIMVIWLTPVTARQRTQYSALWESIKLRWETWTDQFSDILVVAPTPSPFSSANYGETLGLGREISSSDEPVFSALIEERAPVGYRYYWRARSYSAYENGQWFTGPDLTDTPLFPANFSIPYPEWQSGEIIRYSIRSQVGIMDHILNAGQPIYVDRPVEAVTQTISENEVDLITLNAQPPVASGDTYTVESQVLLPTQAELRKTGTDYPLWLSRYLELPEDFSPKIAALAQEISGDLDNPYDKAFAITRYLRINITYASAIPEIAQGVDPMEWFLFQGKTGFCNYYATAQVLMLRSLGIPARLAVGYAEGEFDSATQSYLVREKDSHAWPEVFFANYGWVTFEPTVSQSAYFLPAGLPDEDDDVLRRDDLPQMDEPTEQPGEITQEPLDGFEASDGENAPQFQNERSRTLWTILIVFIVAVLTVLAVYLWPSHWKIKLSPLPVILEGWLVDRGKKVPLWLQQWRHYVMMSVAEKAYRQIGRSIKQLGEKLDPSQTPAERAKILIQKIPEASEPVMTIISEYHLDQYSNHLTNEERSYLAARIVRILTRQARIRKVFKFLKQ